MLADRPLKTRCWIWVPGPACFEAQDVCAEGSAGSQGPTWCERSRLSWTISSLLHVSALPERKVHEANPVSCVHCGASVPRTAPGIQRTCFLDACFMEEFSERSPQNYTCPFKTEEGSAQRGWEVCPETHRVTRSRDLDPSDRGCSAAAPWWPSIRPQRWRTAGVAGHSPPRPGAASSAAHTQQAFLKTPRDLGKGTSQVLLLQDTVHLNSSL